MGGERPRGAMTGTEERSGLRRCVRQERTGEEQRGGKAATAEHGAREKHSLFFVTAQRERGVLLVQGSWTGCVGCEQTLMC